MKNKDSRYKKAGFSLLLMKSLVLLIIFLSFSNIVLAIEIDAGEDKTGCIDDEIQIGGDPTAGPDSPDSYKYAWTSSTDPGFSSDEANPTITMSDEETVYTVVVTDEDGFTCEDFVTVTPVEIKDISFSEPSLPADGSSTATASAEILPPDRTIMWSLEGDSILGCTIDETSGLIKAGKESGYLTVRASDSESVADDNSNEKCYVEAKYCIGSECCRDVYTSCAFGPIMVNFPSKVESLGKDKEGWCEYEVMGASISNLEIMGKFTESFPDLKDINVSWREMRTESSYDFKDVTISWSGKAPAREFGIIQANLTEISLTVSSAGALSGTVTFTVNQTQDKNVGGIAVLKAGTQGTFTYKYTSSTSFEGEFDFGGIEGVRIDLMKGSSKIATLTGSLDKYGNLNARFLADTPEPFSTNGFSAELTQIDLGIIWDITQSTIEYLDGVGQVRIYDIKDVKGEIRLSLAFAGESVSASSTLNNVTAFGCTITGTVTADFDFLFDVFSIVGSDISAKHNEFDQSFTNVGFEIIEGSLEGFNIGEATVKYKDGIIFSMTNAFYNKAQGLLIFDAKIVIGTSSAEVTRFAIDPEGTITIGNINLEVHQSPVDLSVNISYAEGEFKGNYTGTFKGGIGIEGAVVVGAETDFNYAYFALALSGSKIGVPLGNSGLKINKFGGEFGYNWYPGDGFATITGEAQEGTYAIGFLLGIGDIAGFSEVEGHIRLTLGEADAIDLDGSVNVTSTAPYYFQGSIAIHYVLGTYKLNGSLSSRIDFPPTGKIVSLNEASIIFSIEDEIWYTNASGMNGKIFNAIDVTVGLNIGGPLSDFGAMTGTLNGTLNYDNSYSYTYPEGFDPSSCETADDTDNLVGFGISGDLDLHLDGALNATLNKDGIVGAISVDASGDGNLQVKWPCLITCGTDCVSSFAGSASGQLSVEDIGDKTRIYGVITFTSGDESKTGDIDFEL